MSVGTRIYRAYQQSHNEKLAIKSRLGSVICDTADMPMTVEVIKVACAFTSLLIRYSPSDSKFWV